MTTTSLAGAQTHELRDKLSHIQAELTRRKQFASCNLWVQARLGDSLWSKQRDICDSVSRHRRTAVRSCHSAGKSFIASRIVSWWIARDKPGQAFVVTSAPTAPQVKAILWKEINRVHAKGQLPGRTNQTEWKLDVLGKEELVAFGRKPSDYDPTSFQGIHAPRVLVVFDEACGMPSLLWEAADSLISNDDSKILVIGNPDDASTEFANICKPGSGWNVIEISAFDTPNFTGEPMPKEVLSQLAGRTYVEEKRRKWAPGWTWTEDGKSCVPPPGGKIEDTNPFWQSKILGRFPENSGDGNLIPLSWIRAAQQRELKPLETDPNIVGLDVGAGGDASCSCHRKGPVFRITHEDRVPDTMITAGKAIDILDKTNAHLLNVDPIGIGKGVIDRIQEVQLEQAATGQGSLLGKQIVGINVGLPAYDQEHFVNLRAELYWRLRERFEQGLADLDPYDDDTAGELLEIRYRRLSNGKIQIESKDEAKRRGIPSPNRAEAIMLANTQLITEEEWVIQ